MLKVLIPSSNYSELKYTIDVLLNTFLGLDYLVNVSHDISQVLIIGDDDKITFKSSFFEKQVIFTVENIPSKVKSIDVFIGKKRMNLVSLFDGETGIKKDKKYSIDILASTFFMLSRWEEFVNQSRDKHERFPASASLAYKAGFLERPIVNEYVEFLWLLLKQIGCQQKRKERSYKLVPTHDVDKPYLFDGLGRSIKYIAGSLKRRRFSELGRYFKNALSNTDPFDTHNQLMDLAELNNVEAHFFFLQKGKSKQDESYEISSPKIKKLVDRILERGHKIGFHPSYDAFDNESLFAKERAYLEETFERQIDTGRHHFLRWDVSITPQIWQNNNMKWDSTLGYADHAGFRCGVCYPFPLYDLVNNKQLDVYERPLIAMEWSLIQYQGLTIEQTEEKIQELKDQVKKYNGEFVFLYHNSAFFVDEYYGKSDRLLQAFFS